MAKKIFMLLAVFWVAGGIAWAQSQPGSPTAPGSVPALPLPPTPPNVTAGMGHSGYDFGFDQMPNLSTAARSSAGMFGSVADDLINPRFHNPDVDTLLFLGANPVPSAGGHVNVGFARNFGVLYLGIVYSGAFVDVATGARDREFHPGNLPDASRQSVTWNNNLAVLFGVAGMGFRLDANMMGTTSGSSRDFTYVDGGGPSFTESRMFNGPRLALTWGADFGFVAPWARVGYRFADSVVRNFWDDDYAYEQRLTANMAVGASAGARLNLSEASSLGVALHYGHTFPDWEEYSGTYPVGDNRFPDSDFSNSRHGGIGFGLGVYFLHMIEAGIAEIGFSPNLNAGLTQRSNDWSGGTIIWAAPWDRWISVDGGLDVGVRVRLGEMFSFNTGANIRLFDWTYWSQFGGDDMHPARGSAWRVSGVSVGDVGVGVTMTPPAHSVEIGLGLGGFISNTPRFEFTVTTRLGGNGNGAAPAAAPAPAAPVAAPMAAAEAPVYAPVAVVEEGGMDE